MSDYTVNDVLRDAAEYLAEHGWIQGQMYNHATISNSNPFPAACAMGAIESTASQKAPWDCAIELEHNAQKRMQEYLYARGFLPGPSTLEYISSADGVHKHPIAFWNDRPTTTVEDVILALKDAANE